MKIIQTVCLLLVVASGWAAELEPKQLRGLQSQGQGQGQGQANGPPEFVPDNKVPPGLIDNPSGIVGVDFKPGRRPTAQGVPNIKANPRATIRGLDESPIELDTSTAERINVFHPDQFTLSADGTYVTNNETGEIFQLTVFYQSDETRGRNIMYSTDEDGMIMHVRVAPKKKPDEDDETVVMQVQNFQHLPDSDLLIGYSDDDIDLLANPASGGDMADGNAEKPVPESFQELFDSPEQAGDGNRHRRTQVTYPTTRFGKTCSRWDYLDVNILTDRAFKTHWSISGNDKAVAQAIFAEAAEIYWKESCVYLYMFRYESSVGNSGWQYNGLSIDDYLDYYSTSGCGSQYGALDLLRYFCYTMKDSYYRDAWHLFSGIDYTDGGTVGCAYTDTCQSKNYGYGVNHMTYTTNLRLRAVLFAHELGHNLGLDHLSTTNGYWVMEPNLNTAPFDLTPTNANYVRNKVVESSTCGWY